MCIAIVRVRNRHHCHLSETPFFRPSVCLEVGSGSGVVSAFLASVVGSDAVYLYVRDDEFNQDMKIIVVL